MRELTRRFRSLDHTEISIRMDQSLITLVDEGGEENVRKLTVFMLLGVFIMLLGCSGVKSRGGAWWDCYHGLADNCPETQGGESDSNSGSGTAR